MVRSKATPVEKVVNILSESEKAAIRELKMEAEATLKDRQEYGTGTPAAQISEEKIKKEIAHYDDVLDSQPVVKGKKVEDLMREGLRISEILQRGLPTNEEMRHPARNPGAVRKHLKWANEHRDAIMRYNDIRKMLGAGTELPSVEQLRKEK